MSDTHRCPPDFYELGQAFAEDLTRHVQEVHDMAIPTQPPDEKKPAPPLTPPAQPGTTKEPAGTPAKPATPGTPRA